MASHIRNSALYRDRLTENELISDYPADEPLIGGLHALQAYFVAQGQYIDIPVVRVMNAAHFLACYMFGNQVMGAPRTADFLEKATWTLIAIIAVPSIAGAGFTKGRQATTEQESQIQVEDTEQPAELPAEAE